MVADRARLKEKISYSSVVVLGLIVDLGVSWLLATHANFALSVAATCGFVVAVLLNYVLWQTVTFSGGGFSFRRLAHTYVASLAALAVRVVALLLLGSVALPLEPGASTILKLLVASGLSFVANYLFVQRVFKSQG